METLHWYEVEILFPTKMGQSILKLLASKTYSTMNELIIVNNPVSGSGMLQVRTGLIGNIEREQHNRGNFRYRVGRPHSSKAVRNKKEFHNKKLEFLRTRKYHIRTFVLGAESRTSNWFSVLSGKRKYSCLQNNSCFQNNVQYLRILY